MFISVCICFRQIYIYCYHFLYTFSFWSVPFIVNCLPNFLSFYAMCASLVGSTGSSKCLERLAKWLDDPPPAYLF